MQKITSLSGLATSMQQGSKTRLCYTTSCAEVTSKAFQTRDAGESQIAQGHIRPAGLGYGKALLFPGQGTEVPDGASKSQE